jgi:acyl-CoA reductase-like NAD-dependent aldehyde dehydrogenase
VLEYIASARADGARILAGGNARPARRGNYLRPP